MDRIRAAAISVFILGSALFSGCYSIFSDVYSCWVHNPTDTDVTVEWQKGILKGSISVTAGDSVLLREKTDYYSISMNGKSSKGPVIAMDQISAHAASDSTKKFIVTGYLSDDTIFQEYYIPKTVHYTIKE